MRSHATADRSALYRGGIRRAPAPQMDVETFERMLAEALWDRQINRCADCRDAIEDRAIRCHRCEMLR